VRRPPLPSIITDVFVDPVARQSLFVGTLALVAAALDPRVWGPTLPSVQAVVRENPQVEMLMLISALGASGLLLLGGAIGDSSRARPIILGGLAVELLASVAGILVPSGPIFLATRFASHAAAAFVIPVSLALVATSYQGITRATAIGLAYAAYGAAGGIAPVLLQIVPGERAPAFLATIVACGLAIWFARHRVRDLVRPARGERPYVVGTAIWAFGIIAVTVGITWIGGGLDNPVRWAMIVLGVVILLVAVVRDRRRKDAGVATRIERRPVAVAIFVGIVIAVAQTAPMLELPIFFRLVIGFGPLLAVVALAPLFIALVAAGPIAGILLTRFSPRTLVGPGVITVGLANLLLWLIASRTSGYVLFILPCVLIGAGFVIATTVRTAIIFASVPRGLPATAAALNEASISIGMRVGTVMITAIVAQFALSAFTTSVAALPADQAQAAVAAFQNILIAIGTPDFSQIAATVGQADVQPYLEAYVVGVRTAFGLSGVIAVVGGAIAWFALGQHDPLATVYEHRDERVEAVA
jgi:DHA2 family methylenomycin A resistance protein-like MFS transporter